MPSITTHLTFAGCILIGLAAGADAANAAGPMRTDWKRQWRREFDDYRALLEACSHDRHRDQWLRPQAGIDEADRDPVDIVLRRTEALLKHLRGGAHEDVVDDATGRLAALRRRAQQTPPEIRTVTLRLKKWGRMRDVQRQRLANPEQRFEIFADACRLRRRIALANPLLDFDRILFVKRHRHREKHSLGQTYGAGAPAGGGLFILHQAFTDSPRLVDVLADRRVGDGRLAGQGLDEGAVHAPDLSYDGKRIVFSFTQAGELPAGPAWMIRTQRVGLQISYHIFELDVAGGDIRQFTDEPFDDVYPCYLPNGRIVFASSRRRTANRCGGSGYSHTLHVMDSDGSNIKCLSYHDTHEWSPSVGNDGMILYTRWDYVDRGDCIAHHPWICYPDGRDPRAIHGNYPTSRRARPDMEMDIRAVPRSNKLIATASPHHNHAIGSLVLVDPAVPDDGAMAQVKRITPEVRFPEVEGRDMQYATAWPLSEDFYLCSFAPTSWQDDGSTGTTASLGLYLLDSFGNRILLYRDEDIHCFDPIPLRPRRKPAAVTSAKLRTTVPTDNESEATVFVQNVYDGKKPWPDGTVIKALRLVQIFPKDPDPPADGELDFPDASWGQGWMNRPDIGIASESMARSALGTVPVESDGSCYFKAPSDKLLVFQALDANGCAVQGMQSTTYLQRDAVVSCVGCHEPRNKAPAPMARRPRALERPPSVITPELPELAGGRPVFYPALVQPVLNRHCVDCHTRKDEAPPLTGERATWKRGGYGGTQRTEAGGSVWTRSYLTLACGNTAEGRDFDPEVSFAFGLSGRGPSRTPTETTPGRYGALASRLYRMLCAGHHDVKLPERDMRRLIIWLDCNSNFYGAYHDVDLQRQGQWVMPKRD